MKCYHVFYFVAYEHARVIFTLKDAEDLFAYNTVMDMCLIQKRLENLISYKDVCDAQGQTCCPPWSLVNYITLMKNYKSCSEIKVNSTLFYFIYFLILSL